MIKLLQDRGKIILDKDEYAETKKKLKEMEKLEKRHFWLLHADSEMVWKDEYSQYSLDQLQEIISIVKNLSKEKPVGSIAGDNTPQDKTLELKEDIREMIFRKRKDGKPLKGIKTLRDLNL